MPIVFLVLIPSIIWGIILEDWLLICVLTRGNSWALCFPFCFIFSCMSWCAGKQFYLGNPDCTPVRQFGEGKMMMSITWISFLALLSEKWYSTVILSCSLSHALWEKWDSDCYLCLQEGKLKPRDLLNFSNEITGTGGSRQPAKCSASQQGHVGKAGIPWVSTTHLGVLLYY